MRCLPGSATSPQQANKSLQEKIICTLRKLLANNACQAQKAMAQCTHSIQQQANHQGNAVNHNASTSTNLQQRIAFAGIRVSRVWHCGRQQCGAWREQAPIIRGQFSRWTC
jgi:hypothetical protein